MDNAQKAIMIGVGLFITIIVIAAVMLITGMGQDLLNSGTSQLTGISESLKTQIIDQYDEKALTKAQVRTAIVDLINRNDASIVVNLKNAEDKYDEIKYGASYNEISDKLTLSKYIGYVNYDASTGIATIYFTKPNDSRPQ